MMMKSLGFVVELKLYLKFKEISEVCCVSQFELFA
jgi:hypothetical protein